MKAIIFDIQRSSYVDGPGIRTTVFMKGCHLHCAWCHNPESQAGGIQRMWYDSKCTHCGNCAKKCPAGAITFDPDTGALSCDKEKCTLCGRCELFCPADAIAICGKWEDTDSLVSVIKKDKPFYDSTGGGVTVSGGECMLHPDFVAELLQKCKAEGIHTAVDTAGDVPFESFEKVLPHTDLFLYDIKCVTPDLHKKFTGIDNARLIENYKRLLAMGKDVIVRVPMIVECSANDGEFPKIAAFLKENPPRKAELLPYHAMGENKHRALGYGEQTLFTAPDETAMNRYKAMIVELL
ncbi:MAG: glycyl-radical enzyme activating protein [Ruminococcaceae bacterium]|nr:glycyl-radical enzyme activating protein [Oscillospiraceae bacterium]